MSETAVRARPPASVAGPWAWLKANLFASWWSTAVTLALVWIVGNVVLHFVEWGVAKEIGRAHV